jgi:hypothetical protein
VSSGVVVWTAVHGAFGWLSIFFTGGISLGGALVCIPALRAGKGSLAVGVAATQAMLTVLLFLLFGWATRYGLLHVLVRAADELTIWAGYRLAPERQP